MNTQLNALFPEIKPYKQGFIKPDAIHEVFFEVSGNPDGYPVVFLHGGPGGGCNPSQRQFFNPSFYQIILLDQRGCGRSKPLGSIIENTTQTLIADIEAIRLKLNIDKWLVFGGSWGSTLALSYALHHPDRVSGLILRGIFLSRQSELNWFLGQIEHFYPDVWHTLIHYQENINKTNLLQTFTELVFNQDSKVNRPAAIAWNAYESNIMRLLPALSDHKSDDLSSAMIEAKQDIEVARARVQIHYINHQCFINGDEVLTQCASLNHIPTTIVQGRYDMVCPPKTAWELSRVMPHAQFYMIPDAGHSAMESGTLSALVGATEAFKQELQDK